MAETKIKARDWILSISEDGGTTYKPLACLTSMELASTNSPIDVNSQCGNEMLPGDIFDQSISAEGFSIIQTGTPGKVSALKLYDLHTDKTSVKAKIARASEVAGDPSYTGDVFVSEYNETGTDGEAVTFTVTLTVAAPPLAQAIKA